jgi:hypothetical protein
MAAPIITPGGPLAKRGGVLTHFTADQPVTWTTDGGVLSGIASAAVDWTAPNQSGNFHLVGTNGSAQTDTVLITVESVLPNYWEFQNPIEAVKKKLEFEPIAGPTQHRTFGSPAPQHKWELGADDSSYDERNAMKAFWDWHDPGVQFLMFDPVLSETRRYETDSNWSELYKPGDSYSWKFRIKEVWPYAIVP